MKVDTPTGPFTIAFRHIRNGGKVEQESMLQQALALAYVRDLHRVIDIADNGKTAGALQPHRSGEFPRLSVAGYGCVGDKPFFLVLRGIGCRYQDGFFEMAVFR